MQGLFEGGGSGSVVFCLRHGGGLHDLAVRGGMVVIRRPFHRFFSQCIEAAGAGRSVLLFVATLPVEGPIRLFAVEKRARDQISINRNMVGIPYLGARSK